MDYIEEPIFSGKWKVVSLYCNVTDCGWTLFRRYGKNNFLWEFTIETTLFLSSGASAIGGTLEESLTDMPNKNMPFSYYPEFQQLYIDRSGTSPTELHNICLRENYRVELISSTELWLFDLSDINRDSGDYLFKMKVRKQNC